ncbi:MAG: outer membrane lipoprotein-sorting protein [Candidatus Aminicenantes bacterium]|nr:outer membrane lipoprotein-sorting protein [Candidatus Aminicenantes bacterium]
MKKSHVFVLAICLVAASLALQGITAPLQDEAAKKAEGKKHLEKMIEAQGGRDVLSKIMDMTSTGTMEMITMGMSGSITMSTKEPDKMRMDMEIMGMIMTQAYDGVTAWMINPQTGVAEVMPEQLSEDMKRQAMGNTALLDPDKMGITYTYEGTEAIEGIEYVLLKQTFSDGESATYYIHPETYLIYKTKGKSMNQMGVEVESETFLTDYKEFEKTMVPYAITIYQDGEEFLALTLTEFKYNTGLEDSFFQMEK